MKTLEDEALEFVGINPDELVALSDKRIKDAGHFIAGANSKWVQAEKIKVQIELLDKVIKSELPKETIITVLLNGLKQQLKELEDENI